MLFTHVIFNPYRLLVSSDSSVSYLGVLSSKIPYFNVIGLAVIVTMPVFYLFLFKGRLNIE